MDASTALTDISVFQQLCQQLRAIQQGTHLIPHDSAAAPNGLMPGNGLPPGSYPGPRPPPTHDSEPMVEEWPERNSSPSSSSVSVRTSPGDASLTPASATSRPSSSSSKVDPCGAFISPSPLPQPSLSAEHQPFLASRAICMASAPHTSPCPSAPNQCCPLPRHFSYLRPASLRKLDTLLPIPFLAFLLST